MCGTAWRTAPAFRAGGRIAQQFGWTGCRRGERMAVKGGSYNARLVNRRYIALVLVAVLIGGCAAAPASPSPAASPSAVAAAPTPTGSPIPPTPSPRPTLSLAATPAPTPTTAPTTGPLTPSPSAGPTPALEGIWASPRITRPMIESALSARGYSSSSVVGARAFVDYIVYELAIDAHRWTVTEIADGLPWGVGWSGTFRRVNDSTIVAADSDGPCEVTLQLEFRSAELSINVGDDTCNEADLLGQI